MKQFPHGGFRTIATRGAVAETADFGIECCPSDNLIDDILWPTGLLARLTERQDALMSFELLTKIGAGKTELLALIERTIKRDESNRSRKEAAAKRALKSETKSARKPKKKGVG